MYKFEELALITFIALDAIIETPIKIKVLCGAYLDNFILKLKTYKFLK